MNLTAQCLNDEQINSLLQGNLSPHDCAVTQEHLVACEDCRTRVEETIGPDQWWTDLKSVLREPGLDRQVSSESSLAGNRSPSKFLDLLGPTDDPNMLGRIGPYEIVGLLGSGGMGVVFKGFDRSLNRFVAIKMMLPHLASSAAARRRFAREGQAVAAVVDDHVMAIHCVDEWQGVPYLVMTYSRGVSLQRRLSDSGLLELPEILRIGMQIAKGLAAAHAQGIVHRDVKPANIFLDQNVDRVQLMDFGLARAVDDASLTRSGTLAGTPQYMSPEQTRGESVDHRSDLFSLGSVMYTMCTGRAPFRSDSSYGILRLISDKEPRPIRELNPELPEWLGAIIARLMAKRPEDRYESAKEVALLLEKCLAHVQQPTIHRLPESILPTPSTVRRRTPIGKSIVVAAVAFLLLVAGVVVTLELNKGTLSIESEVDDIAVRVTQSDEIVDKLTVSKSGKSLRVAAGRYRVELDGAVDGVQIENNQIDLSRGGRVVVRIVKRDTVADESAASGKASDTGSEASDPLAAEVDRFNSEFRRKHTDHDQPPLTKDELIACASWNVRDDDLSEPVSGLLAAIAQRHQLPEGWTLNGEYVNLPTEATPVRAFRILLRHSNSGEQFTVRSRYIAPITVWQRTDSSSEVKGERSLSAAIRRFNARYNRADGKKQFPLTEDEVIAAILHEATRRDQHDVSDELFQRFQDIARTRTLSKGAEIEVIPTFGSEDGPTFTIWSVRIRLPRNESETNGATYAFILREQFVSVKHGDAGEIHWGAPASNGVQVGVRLNPPLKSYSIGQKVDVVICYRNVLTKPLAATIPNVLSYAVEGKDESGKKIEFILPRMPILAGAQVERLVGEPTFKKGVSLAFSSTSKANQDQAESDELEHVLAMVEAGKSYRLRFAVKNCASEKSELLETGEIELRVNQQVTAPANSDSTVLEMIAAKQLVLVFESSDAIDVSRPIKVLGKQGGVSIQPGSSQLIELPQAMKEMSWHAGDAPEVIGDAGLPEPFTHVWCSWQKNGQIRWRCYAGAKEKAPQDK
jgi:serine/threonine protein kinase